MAATEKTIASTGDTALVLKDTAAATDANAEATEKLGKADVTELGA
jgi:hypothetical protein